MLRRSVCPLEMNYVNNLEMVQLAMKLADPKLVPMIINRVCRASSGLRLRLNGPILEYHETPYEIVKLPNEIQTAQAAADYMDRNHWPDFSERLAVVGCNSNIVVLSSNHICSDGGFLLHLYHSILDPHFDEIPVAKLPRCQTEIFRDEIERAGTPALYTSPQEASSAIWKHGRGDVATENGRSLFLHWSIPAQRLQCWDKAVGRAVGLTENLMALCYLAASAYNGKFTSKCCIPTCVDMRQFMRKGFGFDVGNNFVIMQVIERGVKESWTVRDVMRAMRGNMSAQMKSGGVYPYTRFDSLARDGHAAVVLSNIGKIEVKHPFEDVWMQQTGLERFNDFSLAMLTWSKLQNGRNDVWGRLRYSRNVFTLQEATGIAKSLEYGMEHLSLETPVSAALKQLKDVQDSVNT